MITIEDIHNDMKIYVSQHPQLQDYGFGNIDNISTKNMKFPLLWMQLTPSSYKRNIEVFRADIYIIDILEHDLSNEVKVFSSTSIFTNDTIGFLYDDPNDVGYRINIEDVTKEPVSAKFDDHCNGFVFEIELNIPISYCSDSTPISSLPIGVRLDALEQLYQATGYPDYYYYIIDGDYSSEIPTGSEFYVVEEGAYKTSTNTNYSTGNNKTYILVGAKNKSATLTIENTVEIIY